MHVTALLRQQLGRSLVTADAIPPLEELLNCEHAEVDFQAQQYLLP